MTAAAALPMDSNPHRVSDLLDVLYEILASGLEPDSATVSSTEIESFLHQHARAPKTLIEIEAFFVNGGLPMSVDSLSRDSGLRLTAVTPQTPSAGSGELSTPEPHTGRHRLAAVVTESARVEPRPSQTAAVAERESSGLRWMVVAAMTLLVSACALGGWALLALRDDVSKVQRTQQHLLGAVQAAERRAQDAEQRARAQEQSVEQLRGELRRLDETFFPSTADTVPTSR